MRAVLAPFRALLPLVGFLLPLTLFAMPPHPELLERIRAGEIAEPYMLSHRAELLGRGVDVPPAGLAPFHTHGTLDEDANILAILVDFSDHTAHTEPVYFDSLLFASRFGTLRDFFEEVSYGNLTLVTVNMPSALGWQRAPETYAYYVNGQNGFGSYPRNAQGLAVAAVNLVNPVVDFAQYDNNNDGYVDALFIIHSGGGAERTGNDNDIWSHMWSMPPQHVDGVTASVYSMEPEYWNAPGDMTCGVYAHEMGHSVFFLPDLYDYGYDSEGLGGWSLMAGGSWNGALGRSPAHPDAQSRYQMGFVQPVNLTQNLFNQAIPPIEETGVMYRLWGMGVEGNEYFLVENRQRTGYDAALSGSGLLIYHVDNSVHGNDEQWYPGHEDGGHYRVALEQADGDWHMERNMNSGDAADAYPGLAGNRAFKDSSSPGSRAYSGAETDVSVRRITAVGDTMVASLLIRMDNVVLAALPEVEIVAGSTACVPVAIENDITGRNIMGFSFTVTFDPAVVELMDPYFSREGGILPAGWIVTESHSTPGSLTIIAAGTTPLAGSGTLVCLSFRIENTIADETVSGLNFTNFSASGSSMVDTTNGLVLVQAPRLSVHPHVINFGIVPQGESVERAFVVRNLGHAPMHVDSITLGTPFVLDYEGPRTIAPGAWYATLIHFTATDSLPHLDTLVVYSNFGGGPARVPISAGIILGADDEPAAALPAAFELAQNYPNPFNPSTVFSFSLPRAARVSLRVYDVLGREVAVLADGMTAAGSYQTRWDCSGCAAGVYLAVLSGDDFRIVRKAVLLK